MTRKFRRDQGDSPAQDLYRDPGFIAALDSWADDTAWPEIRMLLSPRRGKVLDLACGTGRAFDFLRDQPHLEYHGCDISPLFIAKAAARGIPGERLRTGNATKLDYADQAFDVVFSIGSLEHFAADTLAPAIAECRRVCRGIQFHLVPTSRSGLDEGWFVPHQAYWNNSERWWKRQFLNASGQQVWTMKSKWADGWSRGTWFICADEPAVPL